MKRGEESGVHHLVHGEPDDARTDWDDLVDAWERTGYDSEPPRCMIGYEKDVIEALLVSPTEPIEAACDKRARSK